MKTHGKILRIDEKKEVKPDLFIQEMVFEKREDKKLLTLTGIKHIDQLIGYQAGDFVNVDYTIRKSIGETKTFRNCLINKISFTLFDFQLETRDGQYVLYQNIYTEIRNNCVCVHVTTPQKYWKHFVSDESFFEDFQGEKLDGFNLKISYPDKESVELPAEIFLADKRINCIVDKLQTSITQ